MVGNDVMLALYKVSSVLMMGPLTLAVVALLCSSWCEEAVAAADRPNIVILFADDVRKFFPERREGLLIGFLSNRSSINSWAMETSPTTATPPPLPPTWIS